MLSDGDKRTLLELARKTAEGAAHGHPLPDLNEPSGALLAKGAAFVTLRLRGELRGCIGHVEAVVPLWESVRDMTRSAAVRDSRFPPLRPEELPDLKIEISVLSPLSPIRPAEIAVGTHGLHVRKGGRGGLLLPQVAVEWGWTPAEFLRQAFLKAGLPPGTADAEILGFTVEKFAS